MLPFTKEQFLGVFADYNTDVWPVQVIAYVLGLVIVALLVSKRRWRHGDRIVGGGLAVMWGWTGVAYHWVYFSSINKAALLFGALFVLQAAVLFHVAVVRGALEFGRPRGAAGWLGWGLVAYALLLYPLIGHLAGHRYPAIPTFGITPCPVTIFTFGVMLLASVRVSPWVLVIPFLWSLLGGSAAGLLGIVQDWMLLASGIVAVPFIVRKAVDSRSREVLSSRPPLTVVAPTSSPHRHASARRPVRPR